MRSSIPPVKNNIRLLIAAMLIAACFVIGGMLYVMQLSQHIANTHTYLETASEHIIADMNEAHLWLEEVLAVDNTEDKQLIFNRFANIEKNFNSLQFLGLHQHLFLTHDELKPLPKLIQQALHTFRQLKNTAQYRLAHAQSSAVGSPSDEAYDKLFKQFNMQAFSIRSILEASLNTHNQHLKTVQTWILFLSLLIMLAVSWLIATLFFRQRQHFEQALRAEQEQHAMEDKYRALIEQSPFAIQIMTPDGKVIQVNPSWQALWQTTKDDLKDYNIFHDDILKESSVFEDIKRGFSGESVITPVVNFNPHDLESRLPWKNRFVRIHLYPVLGMHEQLEQVVLIYADVSDTYQQQAFQAGQARILEHIANNETSLKDVLTELILLVEKLDPKVMCTILLVDDGKQHLAHGIGPSLHPDYLEAINGLSIGAKAGSCGTAAFTKQLVIVSDISTDPLWEDYKDTALEFGIHACWSQPIMDISGEVLGTFAMYCKQICSPQQSDLDLLSRASQLARNAIVHKRALAHLISSKEALKEAQKLAHMGSWERDLRHDSFTCSEEMYHIFELDKHDNACDYQTLLDRIHPEDFEHVESVYRQALKSHQPCEVDYRLLLDKQRIKYIHSKLEAFYDYHSHPIKVMGIVQDMTELVEAQKEKEINLAKMEHVQRLESLGVLAGGIAHDFNNILTTIMGNAGLASHHLPETSPANTYIEHITQASQKAANLCKQMLAYSGKGKFVVKPINLSELVDELSQLLKVTIPKNVVLRLDLSKQLPPIDADVTQMQQVIMNLVINAAEAIGDCSGSVSIATGVTSIDKAYLAETFVDEDLEEGQYVYLEVSDTGCGMDEETHARIFEPFFTTKFTGRGLGMAAILGIVRGHKGAIKSYSELNKGTTFKVFFPRSKEASVPISLDNKIKESWHSQGVVLVIDDEETIREVAVSMCHDMGLKTLTAADGIEGVEIFKRHHKDIDVVLLDMTMPRMGGEDTFSALCRIDPDVKVILSSGYNEQDATNRFAGKGLAGFLQKPYSPEQLATQLAKIFDKT